MKAPSTASTPMAWVRTAKTRATSSVTDNAADCPPPPSRRVRRRAASMPRCPRVKARTTNTTRPPIDLVRKPIEIEPFSASPAMMPSSTQPTTSLAMPAASVICPKFRRSMLSSDRILPITASDEMLIAVAMNNTNTSRPGPRSPRKRSGMATPTPRPTAKGNSRLPAATDVAARRNRRIRLRSVSKPVTISSRSTPIHPTASRAPFSSRSSGRNHSNPDGHTRPNRLGPSTRPAPSSPMTAGWPILRMSAPRRRAVSTRVRIWVQNTRSSCWLSEFSMKRQV